MKWHDIITFLWNYQLIIVDLIFSRPYFSSRYTSIANFHAHLQQAQSQQSWLKRQANS